jgi:hypothetical protein
MAVTEVYLGRHITTTPDPFFGTIGPGVMRATIFDAPSDHIWVDQVWLRMGKAGGSTATGRLMLYDALGGLGDLLGYGASLSVTIPMDSSTSGSNYGGNVSVSLNGHLNGAILLRAGRPWAGAVGATGASITHGQTNASVSGDTSFYDKTWSGTPPNPFGFAPGVTEGKMSLWVHGWVNEPPRVPVNRSPSGTTSDQTPTFAADFRDRNGTWGTLNDGYDVKDCLSKVQIIVRDAVTHVTKWTKTYTPTSAEVAANRSSYVYDGTPFALGSQLEWCITHWDMAGAQSTTSDWLAMTIASAGVVNNVTVGATSEKTGTVTPTITAKYTHASNVIGTKVSVKIRQGTTSGPIVRSITDYDMPDVIPSASPGTTFSVAWASLGFAALDWQTNYYAEVSVKDANGTTTDFARSGRFHADYAPSIVGSIYPASQNITSLPVLVSFALTDADDHVEDLTGYLVEDFPYPVSNATFGVDLSNWTAQTPDSGITRTFTRDTSTTSAGAAAIAVSANTLGGFAPVQLQDVFNVTAGQVYTVRAFSRTTNLNLRVRRAIYWFNSSNALLSRSDEANTAEAAINTFYQHAFTATAPAGAVTAKVGVSAYGAAGVTGTVYFDTVELYTEKIVTAVYNPATALFEHSLDATDVPQFGALTLHAYGQDALLYSGGVTSAGAADRTATSVLTYISGPSVAITSHASGATITTVRPVITYTAPTQVRRNVEVIDQATGLVIRRSGWQVTSSTTYKPSSGYIHQGMTLQFRVTVEDASLLQATTQVNSILVNIPPPSALSGYTLEGVALSDEPMPTALRASWNATTVTDGWLGYAVYIQGHNDPIAMIPSESQTEFIYAHPRTDQVYTMGVSQIVLIDNDEGVGEEVESDVVWLSSSVHFEGLVLTDANDPLGVRYYSEAWASKSYALTGQESRYVTRGDEAPFTVRTAQVWRKWKFVTPILNENDQQAADQEAAANNVHLKGSPICYRDGYGRKDFIAIYRDGGLNIDDGRSGFRTATWAGETETHTEGVLDQDGG